MGSAAIALFAGGCGLFPSFDGLMGGKAPKEAGADVRAPSSAAPLSCGFSESYLKALVPHRSALFGTGIAAEGDTMVVAAPLDRNPWAVEAGNTDPRQTCDFRTGILDPSISGTGVIRTYQRAGSGWREQELVIRTRPGAERAIVDQALLPDNLKTVVFPAYSLALSGDLLAVGTAGDATGGAFRGSVRVFRRVAGTWAEEPYVVENAEGREGDLFGFVVALSGDVLVVGAPGEDVSTQRDGGVITDAGAAHVYKLTTTGAVPIGNLTADFVDERAWYGASVAISSTWLALGAPLEDRGGEFGFPGAAADTDSHDDTGTVYLYARIGEALFPARPIIGADRQGALGASLAMFGNRLAVGAPSPVGPSKVQLYALRGGDAGAVPEATLMPDDPNAYLFGFSVALGSDALMVGAPFTGGQADGAASGSIFVPYYQSSGTAYVFRRGSNGWEQEPCHLKASNADPCDNFGVSVATGGGYFVVGAPLEDGATKGFGGDPASNDLLDSGAVFVYAP